MEIFWKSFFSLYLFLGTEDPIHLDEEFEEEEEGAEAIVEEEDDIEEELDDDYVPINSKGTRRKPRTRGVKKQLPGTLFLFNMFKLYKYIIVRSLTFKASTFINF